MARRKHSELPIYIVEDHCDALPFIYRNIASGHLPFEDNIIVHLDSHPDLLMDKDLAEEKLWDKQALYDSLSIENWILPGCYTGQFSKVCWIRPPWCDQIPEGSHNVIIGKYDGKIRIGTELYYFISDGLFVNKQKLSNSRQFELFVATWPDVNHDVNVGKSIVSDNKAFILDIDLDYFSTRNPFLELFSSGGLYDRLPPIFRLDYDIAETVDYRKYVTIAEHHNQHLENLECVFKHLEEKGCMDGFTKEIPEKLRKQMVDLVDVVAEKYDKSTFDWGILFNAGMTCDMFALPHHVSTENEIRTGLENFEKLLQSLPCKPTIVTIARSSADDYCPSDQVEGIQSSVLEILERNYKSVKVHEKYKDDVTAEPGSSPTITS